ncbi:Uma2 family endonuclease [Dolichospermum circinale]|uniref:Uma2 family endonuclease n=1 Tax=Dolichospermum circinale TaxID=109265 RepID=UPI00232CD2B6|nr:Uma2 family endonuclease [Dolichospermum circinale]MDB9454906.1 Uma2 family endonuclease [Dolichospermum circinale CS-541/06]MDB9464333.1 Uma2 family endonuclease [Dolichospermum circinale CS-541/04]MDB9548888.1 Uma2 family endonuclease [Dolichospermum circinale CS-1031]
MTVSVEYIPVTPVEYPEEDGKPMAEGDLQCSYLTYARNVLRIYFQNRPDVYVAGNLFIYYEKGYPGSVVAPDVFVVFGVEKHDRGSYKTWEENDQTPGFVLEITSRSTRSQDQGAKKGIYAFLGVSEYFQYDPTADYLSPQLQGLHLVDGNYLPILQQGVNDHIISLKSEVLGLELRLEDGKLRFYNPVTNQILFTHEEEVTARQVAEIARQESEAKARKLAAKLRELNIDPDSL